MKKQAGTKSARALPELFLLCQKSLKWGSIF